MLIGIHPSFANKDTLCAFVSEETGETPFFVTSRDDHRHRSNHEGRKANRYRKIANSREPRELARLFFVEVSQRYVERTIAAILEKGMAMLL